MKNPGDTYDNITRILVRNQPTPKWLPDAMPRLVHWVRVLRQREADAPTPSRKEMRVKLTRIAKIAEELAGHLSDRETVMFIVNAADRDRLVAIAELVTPPDVSSSSPERLLRGLAIWSAGAAGAIKGTGPAPEARPVQAGAPMVSARDFCALVVIELWAALRGRRPAELNRSAHRVAESVWTLAGGASAGAREDDRWRRPIQAAKAAPDTWRRIACAEIHSAQNRHGTGTKIAC